MASVLLTRPHLRSSVTDELHTILAVAGVGVRELPMINFELPRETALLDDALLRAARGAFSVIIVSSPTAVYFFEQRIRDLELFEALQGVGRFGAVGHATSEALTRLGFGHVLPVPDIPGSHRLAAFLAREGLAGHSVLLLQSDIGLGVLEHSLVEIGARPERVTLYHTKGPTIGDAARLLHVLESDSRPDVIAFFSPSSVVYFVRSLAEMASGMLRALPALACIGETTAKAVEETLHRRPEIVARKANQRSLAEDILLYLGLQHTHI